MQQQKKNGVKKMPIPASFLESKTDKILDDNREKIFDANEKIAKNFTKKKVDMKKTAHQVKSDKNFFLSCYSSQEKKIISNDKSYFCHFREDLFSLILP